MADVIDRVSKAQSATFFSWNRLHFSLPPLFCPWDEVVPCFMQIFFWLQQFVLSSKRLWALVCHKNGHHPRINIDIESTFSYFERPFKADGCRHLLECTVREDLAVFHFDKLSSVLLGMVRDVYIAL